jgi:hypothetical protein
MLDRNDLLALIHIAAAELGLSDEAYRDMIEARYKVRSAAKLTPYQMSGLLDRMKEMGFSVRAPSREAKRPAVRRPSGPCSPCRPRPTHAADRPADEVRYAVSPTQQADIAQLRQNIDWKAPAGYLRWLAKFHHVLEVKDSLTAGKVIAGLRGICASQHACAGCAAGCLSRPALSPGGPRRSDVPESTPTRLGPCASRIASKLTSPLRCLQQNDERR